MAKMSDNEREMWKRAYTIQEQSLDMPMTAEGFLLLLEELEKAIMDFNRHPLMVHLAVMIYDYSDVRYQQSLVRKELEMEK